MFRKLFSPDSVLAAILGLYNFRFYRKWWGGHWELWIVDFPVCSDIWHDMKSCSKEGGNRPNSLVRGTPRCEDFV